MTRFKDYPETLSDLDKCWGEWCNSDKTLRFGQYMYNTYINDGESFPELFYETDHKKAYYMCIQELPQIHNMFDDFFGNDN